ncbi:MAG: c-type cytochrome [Paracoccaceae bacterium]
MMKTRWTLAFATAVAGIGIPLLGNAETMRSIEPQEHGLHQQEFVHGAPQVQSKEWQIAAGGRIYDNWWEALDRAEPEGTNPAYPVTVNADQTGPGTWRCKECHGWDYQGVSGIYSKGSHFTGIKGIMGMRGAPLEEIVPILRNASHPYTKEMISDDEMLRVALFVSEGLTDMRAFIDYDTRKVIAGVGDTDRGRAIFQTTCAACHGFDGRAMDWGQGDEHNFVGTEAAELPDEVYNKISNAHPGAAMINLRAFSVDDRISVMRYIASLPSGMDN